MQHVTRKPRQHERQFHLMYISYIDFMWDNFIVCDIKWVLWFRHFNHCFIQT